MRKKSNTASNAETPFPEKVIGGIGFAIVVITIGYLIYSGLQPNGPPKLRVIPVRIVAIHDAYLVELTVQNSGHQTAQDAVIEAWLLPSSNSVDPASEPVEISSVTFNYVPPSSDRKGGVLFHHNPEDYNLKFRIKSYILP